MNQTNDASLETGQPDEKHTSHQISSKPADATDPTRTNEATAKPKPHRRRKHHVPWFTLLAVLLVLVLGAGNYWLYQQGVALQQTIARISAVQSSTEQRVSNLDDEVKATQQQQDEQNSNIQHNEAGQQSLLESMNQMSEQMKALASAKGKDPLFWRASEVEFLLSVANQSLILSHNVGSAKTALQDADKRLRQIGDPGLIAVRNKISNEINMLNSLSLPDIAGIAAQLNTLSANLSQLPFIAPDLSREPLANPQSATGFSGLGDAIKQLWGNVVNGLFKIQRTDKPVEPLLPPDEKQYLLNNLKLKLEQARIALVQRQSQLFHNHLLDIEQWVNQYFDQGSPAVQELTKTVQSYHDADLDPKLPDISGSLRELHAWMERQKNVAFIRAPGKQTNLVQL